MCSSRKQLKFMNRKIFIGNIKMETQTVFTENGNINIYPCGFELGKHIVRGGRKADQKGRMITDESGTSHFTPYAKDSGSRYNHLFETTHGEVKESQSSVIFTLRFPKKVRKELMEEQLFDEMEEMKAWLRTRRTNTKWE